MAQDARTLISTLNEVEREYARLYSEYRAIGDPLPDEQEMGVNWLLAQEIRKAIDAEWYRRTQVFRR